MYLNMRISPEYSVTYWKALDFSTEEDWQKAVDVFEDRIYGRYLVPISLMQGYEFAGFAIMALDCLLIETLQQFKEGLSESQSSEKAFITFLTEGSFKTYFDKDTAKIFYKQIRCGILHQAETKESSLIEISGPLVKYSDDKKGLVINRCLFHKQLVVQFETYVSQLRDSSNRELRMKFKKKMDFICRLEASVVFLYSLYND